MDNDESARLKLPVLSVRDLAVVYGGRRDRLDSTALHGVSFDIAAGETLALVGQSGSGKSTLALAAAGLLPANGRIVHGEVHLRGERVTHHDRRRWQKLRGKVLGFIPQDPLGSLDPLQRVGHQLAQSLILHGIARRSEAREQAIGLFDRVGIREPRLRFDAYPHELSGGQLQRVLIAIAVAAHPSLLVADEPTSALDVTVQRRILDLIEDLQDELSLSLLLITHDLALAKERSHRLVVLNHGAVRETGDTATIMTAPRDSYTVQLLADAPALSPDKFDTLRHARGPLAAVPAIEIRDLTKTFRNRSTAHVAPALDKVSFTVTRGAVHALVGESGSGKTTAARIVAGLSGFDSGSVTVADRTLPLHPPATNHHARTLQLVYQNALAALDPKFTIAEALAEPLRIHRLGSAAQRHASIRAILEQVGLPDSILERRPRDLSGGQRQRVAIARALLLQPELLVLDEPTSALDVTVQARLVELLMELKQRNGLTYLFISHDLSLVRQIADEITVLSAGKVVETGPADRILSSPSHPYTADLLAAVPGRGGFRSAA
ncbi:ABC transporter ATP-binding protein [Ancylobacter sp. Lp-2]|uniref:dipeptide ABC transporter ATP-binding protein n=1 Tax=Ancylobacter sp. Lp-2 TaxID=2881339 RepID=UPI001E333B71|nr:ABC transporter ATP-binding protein [Ancylobacter sp. Lp-2]MCB4770436.1 ABC transporter ATP-binding protein [Ancylobacter sp. Lp-2]